MMCRQPHLCGVTDSIEFSVVRTQVLRSVLLEHGDLEHSRETCNAFRGCLRRCDKSHFQIVWVICKG